MEETCETGRHCCHNHGCNHEGFHGEHGEHMKWLVKKAKMELIKEKIKAQLEASEGKKLDEIASIMIDMMHSKKKIKMEMMSKKQELMEKFQSLFNEE